MWSNNMQVLVLATFCLLSLATQQTYGFRCVPCPTDLTLKQQRCGPCPKDCKYGIILDMCGCCRVCALGPGENCFFQFGLDQCGTGFKCQQVLDTQQGTCVPITAG